MAEVPTDTDTSHPNVRVGLLFAEAVSSIEVAWSLLRTSADVIAVSRHGTKHPLRHAQQVPVVSIHAPEAGLERSSSSLHAVIADCSLDFLFPLDDAALALVAYADPPCRLLGPDPDRTVIALDKSLQLEAAQLAGFQVPRYELVHSPAKMREQRPPLILKPSLAAPTAQGALAPARSRYCADVAELEAATEELPVGENLPYLSQQIVRGRGFGVFGLATEDGVLHFSAHRRVRMMNPAGSGSSACAPAWLPPDVRAVSQRFIESIGWHGLFMIELLEDEAGNYWFVELNGRPWGSLALARDCGFEYPAWQLELGLDPRARPLRQSAPNHVVVARHLGREFVHFLFVMRGKRTRAKIEWPSRFSTVASLMRFQRGTRWYNWEPGQTRVFVADLIRTIHESVRKLGR